MRSARVSKCMSRAIRRFADSCVAPMELLRLYSEWTWWPNLTVTMLCLHSGVCRIRTTTRSPNCVVPTRSWTLTGRVLPIGKGECYGGPKSCRGELYNNASHR